MNYTKILGLLLDLGAAMIKSGAETHRVEDSLYRLCAAYRFTQANVWVVPSNIQATVTDPDGAVQTQVRHVRQPGVNFDVLDRLNDVSRRCCADTPDETELARRLSEATANRAGRWLRYSAAVLAGVGFGVFFYCDAVDALVAALASLLITALGRLLSKRESNPLVLNFIISFVTELFILLCVKLGFGHHTGYITVGVVMLLISALGTTNGVRDLVHLDTLSGVMNITASLTGAIGIALGIALPILLLPAWSTADAIGINPNPAVTLIAATVGCVGFAYFFGIIKWKHVVTCAIGSALTWGVFLALEPLFGGGFVPTIIGSAVCALFARIAARINKAPATVFQTICIFPLIPGATLYYTAYGVVTANAALAKEKGLSLIMTCFAIVLGFMAVEAVNRLFRKA
ncbi:MAG: threonine/serine exporter family protein [Clostridia bacterium]|nr:threonine/serine exporter family protein [Clostridia bacterium]